MELMPLLICLNSYLNNNTLRQLNCIIEGMLSMTGRVTMLGISRWTEKGGSYRTIQRFFNTSISQCKVNWLILQHVISDKGEYLLAGDETTVTKSGKKTYGIDRFFSSIFNKPVRGLSFFSLSLISVEDQTSYLILMEQVQKGEKKKNKQKSKKKGKPGRPKGSKNKNKKEVELSPFLLWVQLLIKSVLQLVASRITIDYFVYDGAFGNNNALQTVRQCGLHLISKLRFDSSLQFPYTGAYSGHGPHRKYGDKLDCSNIPQEFEVSREIEKGILTVIYQMHLWHKESADMLNIAVIVKTNLKTGRSSHVILFCSDLNLDSEKIISYYRLRFQIEFNFRDAKQHWGLEDFMNVNELPVYNGADLSMFMVNFSKISLQKQFTEISCANDLKTWFRGCKYVQKVLKLLPEKADQGFIDELNNQLSTLGFIHAIA
ncbi:MAG: transposase [Deltaproteobacteria bacterium]|nr:transposase [Deltaproteobacteria bacterium]